MDTVTVSRENILRMIKRLQESRDYSLNCEVHDFTQPVPEGKVTYPGAVGRFTSTVEFQIMQLNLLLEGTDLYNVF